MTDRLPTIGLHEIHITVDPTQIAALLLFCRSQGNSVKPVLACSEDGVHRNQLMVSVWRRGTSDEIIEQAHALALRMANAGLTPLRTKVEAMWSAENVPTGSPSPGCYWEIHVKLSDSHESKTTSIRSVADKHGAAVSYSVFKRELEPLVTLRSTVCSRADMETWLEEVVEELALFGSSKGIQREYAVYDSAPELDNGWIPEQWFKIGQSIYRM